MILQKWRSRRLFVQTSAFLFLLLIPLLNYYLHFTFFQGWYQSVGIGDLWIVSPLEGIESILVSRAFFPPLLVAMVVPLLIAFTMGRVFCGWVCPIHLFSEILEIIRRFIFKGTYPKQRIKLFRQMLIVALIFELFLTVILGAPIFVMLSPPGLVGRELMMIIFFKTLALEGVFILVVLFLNMFSRRSFCRYLCPLGGMLAILGLKRKLRVTVLEDGCVHCKKCQRSCPLGLYAGSGEGESIYCWSCGNCIDNCPHKQLGFLFHTRN